MTSHWSSGLVGIPQCDFGRDLSGCDCWGIIVLAHAARGIELPLYDSGYISAAEVRETGAIIAREKQNPNWLKVASPEDGDVIVFRLGRFDCHVAMAVSARKMLHMPAHGSSRIEDIRHSAWSSRIEGFYRWAAKARRRANDQPAGDCIASF